MFIKWIGDALRDRRGAQLISKPYSSSEGCNKSGGKGKVLGRAYPAASGTSHGSGGICLINILWTPICLKKIPPQPPCRRELL